MKSFMTNDYWKTLAVNGADDQLSFKCLSVLKHLGILTGTPVKRLAI
jgi:hypothetical protein